MILRSQKALKKVMDQIREFVKSVDKVYDLFFFWSQKHSFDMTTLAVERSSTGGVVQPIDY